MIEFTEWVASTTFPDRPWLMVGKGPSFSYRHEVDTDDYNVLSLNHVVKEMKVDVAHIMDIDVVESCGDCLLTNCDWLVMPRNPHVQFRPSLCTLEDFVAAVPALRELDRRGRLVWYNSAAAPAPSSPPVIEGRYFSSEFALSLLGHMGAKVVRSLGVDGGRGYSSTFGALESSTMLANGQPSFDVQFAELERISSEQQIDFQPLIEPIPVFVGADESQMLAARVLEHTIRKHSRRPVRVTPMVDFPTPMPKHWENRPRTAFSFCRFLIPGLCDFRGRALYLDADMLVFDDIAELYEYELQNHKVACTTQSEPPAAWKDDDWFHPGPQMSVMLLDCSGLPWSVDEIVQGLDERRYTYQQLLFELCLVAPDEIDASLPPEWNHLERYEEGRTKLLHYTIVPTQPWKSDDNPLGWIWMSEFEDALRVGAIRPREVEDAVAAGHVKPALGEIARAVKGDAPDVSSLALELLACRRRMRELEIESAGMSRWVARMVVPRVAARVRKARTARRILPATRLRLGRHRTAVARILAKLHLTERFRSRRRVRPLR